MYRVVHLTLNQLSHNLFDALEERPIDRSVSHAGGVAIIRDDIESSGLIAPAVPVLTGIDTPFQPLEVFPTLDQLREPLTALPDAYGGVSSGLCYTSAV